MRRAATARVLAAISASMLALAACGGGDSGSNPASSGGAPANPNVPSWCGSKQIALGLTDGFGGNSWRLVTTAAAKEEAAKCPSVTSFEYADGQGNTQKAISDIQGMVAKGVNALVVFPDAGQPMLPALRSAHGAGVVTVPYRVTPGGEDGKDYDVFVGTDFSQAGTLWGQWIQKILPDGGNVLFLSQLDQFVLALGVSFAIRTLVEAAALTIGVALYSLNWRSIRHRFVGRAPVPGAAS